MILSAINPKDLVAYISSGNANVLQSIKGIGSKTAQRIIIELKDKVLKTDIEMSDAFVLTQHLCRRSFIGTNAFRFSKQAAGKAVEKIIKSSSQTLSVEEIIKQSLKIL